jgi:hypothetical protein
MQIASGIVQVQCRGKIFTKETAMTGSMLKAWVGCTPDQDFIKIF